jgi:NAD-dependent deacetylase
LNVIDDVIKRLIDAKKISFLTGAGISAASNIPTFRGEEGYWKKYNPLDLATQTAFNKNPKLVWEWYYERRKLVINTKPNYAHYAIAELEKYKDVWVITQNIDGLHKLAGSTKVLELHGNIFNVKCTNCNFKGEINNEFSPPPPICKICKSYLRPDVVWFDEDLDPIVWNNAVTISTNSDILIIVGTSLLVEPANELPILAKRKNLFLIEINPKETKLSHIMNSSIRTTAVEGLRYLLENFKKNIY